MAKLTRQFLGLSSALKKIYDWLEDSKAGRTLLIVLAASLIFRWFYYIDKYSVNVLFYDMWTFYEPLFNGNFNPIELFSWQHGPHRQGIGFVLSSYLDQWSGWNSRWLTFAIGIMILITALLYLWLKKQLLGNLRFVDVVIVFIVVTPAQYGLFANTPNISHGAAPALLVSLFCLAWFIRNPLWRYGVVLLINFLLIFSAFGFFMGLITPLALLLDLWHNRHNRRLRNIVAGALPLSLISLLSFFIDYTFNATANPSFSFPHEQPLEYLQYMAVMMGRALSSNLWTGAVALFVILAIGLKHGFKLGQGGINAADYRFSKIIVILILYSFAFMLSTSIGRVSIGMAGAKASRYTPYLIPAIVAVYLHISSISRGQYKVAALLMLIFMLYQTTFIHYELGMMKKFSHNKRQWKEMYLQSGSIEVASRGLPYGIHQEETSRGPWLQERLDYLEENKLNLFADQDE